MCLEQINIASSIFIKGNISKAIVTTLPSKCTGKGAEVFKDVITFLVFKV